MERRQAAWRGDKRHGEATSRLTDAPFTMGQQARKTMSVSTFENCRAWRAQIHECCYRGGHAGGKWVSAGTDRVANTRGCTWMLAAHTADVEAYCRDCAHLPLASAALRAVTLCWAMSSK
eukprot:3287976-Pleurochrysis_carterae.AAC.1